MLNGRMKQGRMYRNSQESSELRLGMWRRFQLSQLRT